MERVPQYDQERRVSYFAFTAWRRDLSKSLTGDAGSTSDFGITTRSSDWSTWGSNPPTKKVRTEIEGEGQGRARPTSHSLPESS